MPWLRASRCSRGSPPPVAGTTATAPPATTTARQAAAPVPAPPSTDECGFDQATIDAAKKEGSVNVVGANFEEDAKKIGD